MANQFPPDLEEQLKERMATGQYVSEDDVLREAGPPRTRARRTLRTDAHGDRVSLRERTELARADPHGWDYLSTALSDPGLR